VVDLESALLMIKHFHWQPPRPARRRRKRKPGPAGLLAIHRWVEPPPSTGEDDEPLIEPMIGFQDTDGAELVISARGELFNIEMALPTVRSLGLGLHFRGWRQRQASTSELADMVSIVKLFFNDKRNVLDDLLHAAEQTDPDDVDARAAAVPAEA
jgi:hypothetical protein